MKVKVYIASPYSSGWHADNVKRQLDAMKILMDEGFVPFAPLMSHFVEIHHKREPHQWMDWELEWLKDCDVLVRLRPKDENGREVPSPGSDAEQQKAKDEGLLTFDFDDLTQLESWAKSVDKKELLKSATETYESLNKDVS